MTKQIVLMSGLPGAGKSTLATQMKIDAEAEGKSCIICSTDDFFMQDGVYKFDPDLLFRNHRANQNKVRQACEDGVSSVIVDNTNLRREHREEYQTIAAKFGYSIEHKIVGEFTEDFAKICGARNQHNVPLESILKMARRYQAP